MEKKLIPTIFSLQNSSTTLKIRTCFVTGICKLSRAIFLFIVPPIAPQWELPWLVAKNDHIAWNTKLFTWLHKFIRFFKFLYWPAQPSLQYSICLIWGNVSWIKLHTNLWSSWTKLVLWSRSSERLQIDLWTS